jgi:hypothetical protein
VGVRVDESGADGQPRKVVRDRARGRGAAHAYDLGPLHHDVGVVKDLARAVKDVGRLDHNYAVCLRKKKRRRQQREADDEPQRCPHMHSFRI